MCQINYIICLPQMLRNYTHFFNDQTFIHILSPIFAMIQTKNVGYVKHFNTGSSGISELWT